MEIQQHDGVVVDAAAISAGLRQAQREGEVSREGEGGARGLGATALPPPSLYRDPRGGGPRRWDLLGGAAAKGVACPPKASGGAPTPRVSNPRRRGGPRWDAPAHQGLVPLPLQPMGPSEIGGPTRWTPGTLLVIPVQYR